MNFVFSELENKLILDIAQQPQSIATLAKKYVADRQCSRAGFYKALNNLQKKGVLRESKEAHAVCLNNSWVIEGREFFRKLRVF